MDNININYAVELGRREKRLKFFRNKISNERTTVMNHEEVSIALDKYALLISKLFTVASSRFAKDKTGDNAIEKETWDQLIDLDRQLDNFFSNHRLLTAEQ